MDIIRSCYSADMNFYSDSQGTLNRVLWYFADQKAEILPYPNAFGSRVWEIEDSPEPQIGERYDGRKWSGGLPASAVPRNGQCGTADEWSHGIPIGSTVPIVYPGTLIPTCCPRPPEAANGGVVWGLIEQGASCLDVEAAPDTLHITFQLLAGTTAPGIDGLKIPVSRSPSCPLGVFLSEAFPCDSEPVTHTAIVVWACTGFTANTFFYFGDASNLAVCQNTESFAQLSMVNANPILGISDFKFLLDPPGTVIRAYLTL